MALAQESGGRLSRAVMKYLEDMAMDVILDERTGRPRCALTNQVAGLVRLVGHQRVGWSRPGHRRYLEDTAKDVIPGLDGRQAFAVPHGNYKSA